jgi:hypothetical protein
LGKGLAINSGEAVTAYFSAMLVAETSTSGRLDVAPRSSVATSGMEDADHASAGEPCLGF